MQELYNKLKKYSIDDAIKIEESDRQYLALERLYKNITDKGLYLILIISNSLICYQLSGKGEDYWEELSEYFSYLEINKENILSELGTFIKQSKNNRRFIDTKIKRLKKVELFLNLFYDKQEYYYDNMLLLRDDLAKFMKQKKDAKTIVFAVKMFSYGARNIYNKINYFPDSINVPVDSRLIALFEKYKGGYKEVNNFYYDLSKKLNIPELHLDAILWVNYDNLIK